MKIRILNEAEQDLIDEGLFYEVQEPGLGDHFLVSLCADIDSLQLFGGIQPLHDQLPGGSLSSCRHSFPQNVEREAPFSGRQAIKLGRGQHDGL